MASKHPQTYIFDLDGVIYRGDEPLPHASETLRELRNRGCRIYFLTNNATKSREDYQSKLEKMHIEVSLDEIMTSAYATALYLKELGKPKRRAYVVGEAGLAHELEGAGTEVVSDDLSEIPIDYVVVGLDRHFTYQKLYEAQQAILAGAKFIATNTDATLPQDGGVFVPGGGSIVAAVQTASGVAPKVIGKPETYALDKILEFAGCTADESVMVGDRLETDILIGNRVGMHSVLILTGVADENDAATAPQEMRPERIIADLIELLDDARCA